MQHAAIQRMRLNANNGPLFPAITMHPGLTRHLRGHGFRSFVLAVLLFMAGNVSAAEQVRVLRVIDGDSVVLQIGERQRECRLIGIDAPEWAQKPWGDRARSHLASLLDGTSPFLSVETDVEQLDKHGRLLVYLRDRSGNLVNVAMVEDGMALAFNKRPNLRNAALFRAAEKRARNARKGIWGTDGLKERPGAFRERNRKSKGKTE